MGKQYKDSAYVHVSDFIYDNILNYNQVKLRTIKVSHPDEIQNTFLNIFVRKFTQ